MVGPIPRLLVWVAAASLPVTQRGRYYREFTGDLWSLDRRDQWRYALRVLLRAPLLRLSLARRPAPAGPPEAHFATLGCLTGLRHDWRRESADDGVGYRRCRRCGRDDDATSGPADGAAPFIIGG